MIKKLIPALTLILTAIPVPSFAEQIQIKSDVNLMVTILKPVCKLASVPVVDFGDKIYALDVITDQVNKQNISLKFSECDNVSSINIEFKPTGSYPFDPQKNNWIPNKEGDEMASGVAVSLSDGNKTIDLAKIMKVSMNSSEKSKTVPLIAKIIPTDKAGSALTHGKLDAAVGIEVSYD